MATGLYLERGLMGILEESEFDSINRVSFSFGWFVEFFCGTKNSVQGNSFFYTAGNSKAAKVIGNLQVVEIFRIC